MPLPVPPSCSEGHTGQEEKGENVGEKATRQQSEVSPSGERYLEPAVLCRRLRRSAPRVELVEEAEGVSEEEEEVDSRSTSDEEEQEDPRDYCKGPQ